MGEIGLEELRTFVGRVSRTSASGVVDVSSSAAKEGLDRSFIPPEERDRRLCRARDACNGALRHGHGSPRAHRELTEAVNTAVTGAPFRYRDFEPPTLPYAPVDRLHSVADELWARLGSAQDATSAPGDAAAAIWAIDLYGHLFADGCCRTSLVMAAFLLRRAGHALPELPRRELYYAAPYDEGGTMSADIWEQRFLRWCALAGTSEHRGG